MIGHTGVFEAARSSLKSLDGHVKDIIENARINNYIVILTADHGNAEIMINEDMTPNKTHTYSKVPFIILHGCIRRYDEGSLADVAPTILHILGIDTPPEMQGNVLINPF
jgi:2,3-bisphosphoglycerate-independent phosphoglycerate mutase